MSSALCTLDSQIHSVAVFELGAEVTRRAVVPEGGISLPARVAVSGLPLCLSDGSLSARVEAEARVVEASIDVELQASPTTSEERLEEMRFQQRKLQREAGDLNSWIRTLRSCTVPERAEGKEGEPPPKLSVHSRLAWIEFLAHKIEEKQQRLWEIEDAQMELQRALEEAVRENEKQAIAHKMALLTVDGEGKLEAGDTVEVKYRVPGVRWAPSYLLNFNETLTQAQVSLRVSVAQNSGEDWSEVMLSVTSAGVQEIRELPELMSVRIGRTQPPPPGPSWKAPPLDTDALFEDFDRILRREGAEAILDVVPELPPEIMMPEPEEPVCEDEFFGDEDDGTVYLESLAPSVSMPAKKKSKMEFLQSDLPAPGGGGGYAELAKADERSTGAMRRRSAMLSMDKEVERKLARPVSVPDPVLRDYSRLVMPDCRQHNRGRLAYQSLEEQVAEKARELGLPEERFKEMVRTAIGKAEAVGYQALPQGFRNPRWPGDDGFDLYFSGENRCSIPSDGAFHSQPLMLFEVDFKPRYVGVPRETPQVFRYVEGGSDKALPAGPADIYLGRDFLLSGPLEGAAPGGTIHLALGVEERIKIVRNTSFQETVSGMVSKTRKLEHTIEVEVLSNMPREALVEIRERLPQAPESEDDIEVAVTASNPAWETFVPEERPDFKGGKRWVAPLPAGAKKEFSASYTVSIPAKYDLDNGNRRE